MYKLKVSTCALVRRFLSPSCTDIVARLSSAQLSALSLCTRKGEVGRGW
ncbi:hypothetical protein HMPREF1868_00740 [Olsenella sp. DNF00959]|nr:hypothetical protein HMPREF1868_00740 [Olsenella sp. DNF00959]